MFIAVEGQDYVGKSTQVRLLIDRLTKEGYNVFGVRSPGGCPDAEAVRDFMLTSVTASPDLRNILAGLSRQLTTKVIADYLQTTPTYDKIVVSDRWITSGYAYQVCGEGVAAEKFYEANQQVRIPDLEIRLLMTDENRAARKKQMEEVNRDVMEVAESDPAFAKRVANHFWSNQSVSFPVLRIFVGTKTIEQIHEEIWEQVQECLNPDD